MPHMRVRDVELYYERAGSGPTLLFIHGMCGDAEVWSDQVARLSDRFDCITYDRRGHTRSTRGDEPESPHTHALDAAALINAMDVTRPIVVGSSGGARITVELARTHPELIGGVVISEPPIASLAGDLGPAFMAEIAAAVRPAAEAGGPRAAVDAFFPLLCPGLWSGLDEARRDRYRANGDMLLAEFAGAPLVLSEEDVSAIDVPALVVAGDGSHPALRLIARVISRAMPDARFVELAGSGHVTYAEQPAEFARAVAAFAGEIAALIEGSNSQGVM